VQQCTTAEDLDVARLVGRLNRQELHHFTEVGVESADEACGDDQSCLLVFNQEGHDLDGGGLDVIGDRRRRYPVHCGRRIPLAGRCSRVQPWCDVGPDPFAVDQFSDQRGSPGFDQGTAGRKTPALVGVRVRWTEWITGARRAAPAAVLRCALHDYGLLGAVVEGVTLRAAPGR
jgi:hypothetical protein